MKTEIIEHPRMTLEKFADKHCLTMQVMERSPKLAKAHGRYFASFKNADVHRDHMLHGVFGNGETPEQAIAEYAKKISGQLLTIDGGKTDILCPTFV